MLRAEYDVGRYRQTQGSKRLQPKQPARRTHKNGFENDERADNSIPQRQIASTVVMAGTVRKIAPT